MGAETIAGSGIYAINVAPKGFNFESLNIGNASALQFDIYGAGTGTGSFDSKTGNWSLDMPTIFVNYNKINTLGGDSYLEGVGIRADLHLTTQNILIPKALWGPGTPYTTTYASPMILDEASPEPWGDLHLVAGGCVPTPNKLTLAYDWALIDSIATKYDDWYIDEGRFAGAQYEFDIYGNDPLIAAPVPEPVTIVLLMSGLAGLAGLKRKSS